MFSNCYIIKLEIVGLVSKTSSQKYSSKYEMYQKYGYQNLPFPTQFYWGLGLNFFF